MKNIIFLLATVSFYSCKKNYTCVCYTERRGFVETQYTKVYKATKKNKNKALADCESDYRSDPQSYDQAICELK